MTNYRYSPLLCSVLTVAILIGGCGGGSSSSTAATQIAVSPASLSTPASTTVPITEAGAPVATGNTATDGLNWFNFRRQQLGEPVLARTPAIDVAALGHSQYQQANDTITHVQVVGKPGFTGVALTDRLSAANYRFVNGSYAYGEVISSTIDQSGFNAAEELITAIYHRFAIFEPEFRQAGVGSAVSASGRTYLTVDMTVDGLSPTFGKGGFVVYPMSGQQGLPSVFSSDAESPDPVPNQNLVGYPISIHADITSVVQVQTFTVRPRNGAVMQVVLLARASDPLTPASAAAIIPLSVLTAATVYDVQFSGTVDGVAVSRSWSFTTR